MVVHLHIDSWIHEIDILLVEFLPKFLDGFSKTLKMHDFAFPKEFDHIVHIRIIGQSQNIVVGYPRFLFWERIA